MGERIEELIDKWPENKNAIRTLQETDMVFDALCLDYCQISDELRQLEESSDPSAVAEAQSLATHRNYVEEAIIARLEGYQPV